MSKDTLHFVALKKKNVAYRQVTTPREVQRFIRNVSEEVYKESCNVEPNGKSHPGTAISSFCEANKVASLIFKGYVLADTPIGLSIMNAGLVTKDDLCSRTHEGSSARRGFYMLVDLELAIRFISNAFAEYGQPLRTGVDIQSAGSIEVPEDFELIGDAPAPKPAAKGLFGG